jgi:hypothetical protein
MTKPPRPLIPATTPPPEKSSARPPALRKQGQSGAAGKNPARAPPQGLQPSRTNGGAPDRHANFVHGLRMASHHLQQMSTAYLRIAFRGAVSPQQVHQFDAAAVSCTRVPSNSLKVGTHWFWPLGRAQGRAGSELKRDRGPSTCTRRQQLHSNIGTRPKTVAGDINPFRTAPHMDRIAGCTENQPHKPHHGSWAPTSQRSEIF